MKHVKASLSRRILPDWIKSREGDDQEENNVSRASEVLGFYVYFNTATLRLLPCMTYQREQ